MDSETPREKWAGIAGMFGVLLPTLAVSGFEPELGAALPVVAWIALATLAGAVAGAIATPLTVRGAATGAAMASGFLLGTLLYVVVRTSLTGGDTFFKLELAVAGVIGMAPNALAYAKWARPSKRRP